MAHEAASRDINTTDLARLAREVARTGKPARLAEHGAEIAVLSPARPRRRKVTGATEAQWQAILSAVGGWEGLVDGEQLKRDLDAARSDARPPIEL